jgi:transposase
VAIISSWYIIQGKETGAMTNAQEKVSTEGLLLAIEVSEGIWRLAFTDLKGTRQKEVGAWEIESFRKAVASARKRFGLDKAARVRSCYEAGRVGFSLHRFLEGEGIENVVVDPASIEVNRRRKHNKTDRLDAEKLSRMLVRYHVYGEKKCWQVCRVPTAEQEAERRLDREYERLKKEQKSHVSRVRSLLALHGAGCAHLRDLKPGAILDWSGAPLAAPWQEEIGRELVRLRLVNEQVRELTKRMKAAIESPQTPADEVSGRLHALRSIGPVGATALSRQFFAWRQFKNRREVGAAAGLASCPYASGTTDVDQGISKAGHGRIRTLAVELSWFWLRYQPASALSRWYNRRFGRGGAKRMKRIGIVALARKLLVALWKYLEFGLVPEGAKLRPQRGGGGKAARARGA